MTAVVLHLSDIHIKTAKDPVLKRGADIAATVFSSLPSASHVFIVISGDVAFSGHDTEYDLARVLFLEIQAAISTEAPGCPVSFVMAPGNHDCDFREGNAVRKLTVESLEKQTPSEIDGSVIDTCTSIGSATFFL